MVGYFRRRSWYRSAVEDFQRGWSDAVAGTPRDPTQTESVRYNRRFRIAYDAGYELGGGAPLPSLPRELPVEVWALVYAEAVRP